MAELFASISAILAARSSGFAVVGGPAFSGGGALATSFARPAGSRDRRSTQDEFEEHDGNAAVREARGASREASQRGLAGRPRGTLNLPNEEEETLDLVERARSGDADAYTKLFGLHREKIQRLCARMLDDNASAEDATSEVYLRARRALASYDPARPFRPWLSTLASNYCIDQLRRRKQERALFHDADRSAGETADDRPGALTRITRRQDRQALLDALDRLPARYRLPLVLRFYRELDYDAIAEILGVTRNQVGTLLFRAKKRLREDLEGTS